MTVNTFKTRALFDAKIKGFAFSATKETAEPPPGKT